MNDGTKLLLLPGLMNDGRVWQNQLPVLRSSHREVVVATTFAQDTVAALASEAIARMPAGPFAVAGFSLGGYVALEVFRQARQRVLGMALLDTGARADSEQSRQLRQRMIDGVATGSADFSAVAASFLPRLVHPSRVEDSSLTELLISMARAVGAEGFARQQRAAMARPDSVGMLPEITCPTLILCGREDQVTPPEWSEEMARKIPAAKWLVIPHCGHMAPLEQPGAVNAAMDAWLAGIEGDDSKRFAPER